MPQTQFEDEDGTLSMLRDSVTAFADRFPGAERLRAKRTMGQDLDREVWTAMAEAGWTGLLLPEDLGGAGLGCREQAVLSESLGRVLGGEPLVQLAVLSGALLADAPAGAERSRLAAGITDGSLIVSPAWQALDGTPADLSATIQGDQIRLAGKAHLVSAASTATDFLVRATHGAEAVLISVPASGVAVAQRPTVDGAMLASVTLDTTVPAANILARGERVAALFDRAVELARLALAAELAGLASRALELTVDYTKQRVQFGKPIASFQALQHRMVDMWGEAEFACCAVVNAAEALTEAPDRAASLAVLAAKARAGDAATSVTRKAIQLYGAMGFTDECDIGLYMKRAVALNATLGNPEALRLHFLALERAA